MKKVVSWLLSFTMIFSLVGMPSVYAATSASGTFSTTIEQESVSNTGEGTFEVNVNADSQIEGVCGLELHLKFDVDKLEMVGNATKHVSSLSMTATQPEQANAGGTTAGIIKFIFEDADMEGKTIPSGKLYSVKFKVKAGAAAGAYTPELAVEVLTDSDANTISSSVTSQGSITITKAPIAIVTASVAQPVKGTALVTTVDVDIAAAYTGTVEWYEGNTATGTVATGSAKAGQVYTAKITLTAKAGESFADSVTAPAGYTLGEHDGSKVVLTKTFPATDSKTLSTLEVTSNTVDSKKHGDTIDKNELTVKATYDDSTTDNNYQNYEIVYNSGSALSKGDTKFKVKSGDIESADVSITTVTGKTAVASNYELIGAGSLTYTGSVFTVGVAKKSSAADAGDVSGSVSFTYCATESGTYNSVAEVKNAGYYKAVFSTGENTVYDSGTSLELPFVVSPKALTNDMIVLDTQETYNGSEQSAKFSVKDGATLTKDTDYTITSGDKATNVETKTLTIAGKGNYTGEAQKDWSLVAKDVTITPDALSKTYGEVDPDLTYTTSIDSDTTLKSKFDAAKSGTLGRASGEDVNTYAINLGTLAAGSNFSLTLASSTVNFTITAKNVSDLTATISDQTTIKGVGEFVDPTITGVNSESVAGTFTYDYASETSKSHDDVVNMLKAKNANEEVTLSYTFTPSNSNYTGTKTGNFKVTVKDIEFLVSAAPATVDNTLTVKANPVYGDDWSEIVKKQTGVTIKAKVGSAEDTTQANFTLKQSGRPNAGGSQAYELVYNGTINGTTYTDVVVVSGTVNVAPKTLTAADLTHSGPITKAYDTNTNAPTGLTVSVKSGSLVGTDTLAVTGTLKYNSANVNEANKITFTPDAITTGNYALAASEVLTITGASITQATLTADGTASATADYGTALKNVPVTGLTAKLNGVEVAGSWAFSGETILDAGNTTAYTATFTPTSGASNYNALTASIVPTINKIAYTGSAITATKNVLTNTAVNGVEVDMTSLLTGIKGAAVSAASENSNTDNIISNVSKDGNKVKFDVASIAAKDKNATINVTISSTNYTDITATITVITVDKADADVSISGAPTSKTYGDADFNLTASAATPGTNGTWTWVSSDSTVLQVTGSGATATVKVLKSGSATITAKYESDTTMGEQPTAPITVGKRVITVTADNKSMTVNGTLPTFTVTYGNLPSGVQAEDIFGTMANASTTTDGKTTGSFDITVTTPVLKTEAGANYEVGAVTKGTLTVNPRSSSGGGGSVSTYSVTVGKTKNGTVSVSPKTASKGDIVTVTVTPDKGYTLETLTVLDKNDKEIKLTEKNGKFTFTMPASKVEVKATFMDDNTMLNYFVDVKAGDFFYDAVLWAAQKGITTGVNAVEFGPSLSCTRAQIVTFLWRAAGSPEPKGTGSFADVPADSYYAKAVAWAVENGITGGTGDDKFSPNATCTREQAVAFLYRASGSPAVSGGSAFSDVAATAYYADAVAWAEKNEITGGIGGGLFGAGNDCTRGQIVTFLYRAYQGK